MTQNAIDVPQILAAVGAWDKAEYTASREGVDFKAAVYIREEPLDPADDSPVPGRRGLPGRSACSSTSAAAAPIRPGISTFSAWPRSSFCCFHYTGKLNTFDKVIYWGNVAAGLLAPTVFLHFCLTFPEARWCTLARAHRLFCTCLPRLVLLSGWELPPALCASASRCIEVRWMLDRIWIAADCPLPAGRSGAEPGIPQSRRPHRPPAAEMAAQRHLLRLPALRHLLRRPYALGMLPNQYMRLSVLSLLLIPLTLAYAIVRYRLMDVDIIFRRGYAYTLATLCVLAAFYGVVFSLGSLVQKNFKDLGNTGLITVMLIAAFLFQPHPQLDSGTARPLLLPRPLRLPPHPDRVRARTEFGDRSGPHAAPRWPTA